MHVIGIFQRLQYSDPVEGVVDVEWHLAGHELALVVSNVRHGNVMA